MTLTITDLSVGRGGLRLLDGVGLRLRPGRALVLRGPNGVGKTTLLRCIAGLHAPISGRIDAPAGGLAFAGHADGIKPTLSVAENLIFWARIFGHVNIAAALAAWGLQTLADRPAGMLSAGQKRRLGLARLLVTGRPVWLLDEPTVSLDRAAVGIFGQVMRAHLEQGGSALIATHVALGLDPAPEVLDLEPCRANAPLAGDFDEAFL